VLSLWTALLVKVCGEATASGPKSQAGRAPPGAAHMLCLGCLPGARQTQCHLALGPLPLGCRTSATWHLSCLYF